jgi:hypothetical protein
MAREIRTDIVTRTGLIVRIVIKYGNDTKLLEGRKNPTIQEHKDVGLVISDVAIPREMFRNNFFEFNGVIYPTSSIMKAEFIPFTREYQREFHPKTFFRKEVVISVCEAIGNLFSRK